MPGHCQHHHASLAIPREALEIAGTSINFRSGKFGYSICPFLAKCRGVVTASSSIGKMSSGAIGDRSTWELLLSPRDKDLPRFGHSE